MINIFENSEQYKQILNLLKTKNKTILVKSICDSAKIYFASLFNCDKRLIILADERSAYNFYNDYKFYDKNVYYFEENDILFSDANIDKDNTFKNRINIIKKLINNEKITIISTIQTVMEKMVKYEDILKDSIDIKINDVIDYENLIRQLVEYGYERNTEVEVIGDYSIRGGIIDIFDYKYEMPIRIELFDNVVESIRFFNLESKRSVETVKQIKISNRKNNFNNIKDSKYISILDYFNENDLIFMNEPEVLKNRAILVADMISETYLNRTENEDVDELLKVLDIFDYNYIFDEIINKNSIQMTSFDDLAYTNDYIIENYIFDFDINLPTFNKKDYNSILETIKKYEDEKYKGYVVINSLTMINRLYEEFTNNNIICSIANDTDDELINGNLYIINNKLNNGFVDKVNKFFIFTENDLFGIEAERRKRNLKIKKYKNSEYEDISSINQLKIGDYVVHEQYGIGIYRGINRLESDGIMKDYISIEYDDNAMLYVLVTKLDVIQKYASKNSKLPKLNKLSNNDFYKQKQKVKEEVLEIAKDLIELYAIRSKTNGYKYSNDNLWQKEFEETFPYIETLDQLRAIEQVKADMESNKPMDRLICGDVGFGKTEVALRAAFKAVQDNKQVAFLVPTTILCMQHFNTFIERFNNYPITVDFLSRFKTNKDINDTIKNIKEGKIDIVIGTHRLLSEDIGFKDLGLLIIDEEQRFGVSHKEKIKRLKQNVDVLTLSATPIPRTLYMSLSGIRDMSLLTDAPPERVPIKTYVFKYNDELIREAIDRELKRDGQVFIIHNKVLDIYEFADKIRRLCPYANIDVVHGKLDENELSIVMSNFINNKTNVLISTTIIETGIDIKNANTLIVDNADKFGLAQLYQLRGRVGRSDRTAYAFFLYNKEKTLTEDSEKRLKAIKEFKSLGSGIKIAMRDLEIRGAGNVLGLNQSGHVDAVGYDLYMKLLNEAIKHLKTDNTTQIDSFMNSYDTVVDIDIDAYIPDDFEPNTDSRLELYRKISNCKNIEDFDNLKEELIDRYSKIPIQIENLIYIAKIKNIAHSKYIVDLKIKTDSIRFVFYEKSNIDTTSIVRIIQSFMGKLKMISQNPLILLYQSRENSIKIDKMLDITKEIIDKIEIL